MKKNIPKHVAIIMDGNGRWATKRHLPRLAGHKVGMEAMKGAIQLAQEFNIEYLSFFAFSTENWKRDQEEINGIFDIVRQYIKEEKNNIADSNIKLEVMGDISKIPADLKTELENLKQQTQNNTGLVLNLGINYGGRDELAYAFNKIQEKKIKCITSQDIANNLYTSHLPDPDLVIRTSGEQRLSGFMLFQIAYSEIYFIKTNWPSFGRKHFKKALRFYSKRERRFGGNHLKL